MSIPEYLRAKQQEVKSILQTNGCSLSGDDGKKGDEFIAFLLSEADGIYDISMKVSTLFNVDFKKADAVDQQIYKSIINPKYDQFVKYNEELRKTNVKRQTSKAADRQGNKVTAATMAQGDKVNKANFYFSPEDEEEIRRISQQSTGGSQQKMEAIYERVADEIIERLSQSGITNFPSVAKASAGRQFLISKQVQNPNDQLENNEEQNRRVARLKKIIVSSLKDARDAFETKEALAKPWKIGGMEVSVEEAERIVKEVEKAKEALGEELKLLNVAMRQSANAAMRDREIASSVRLPHKDIIGKQDLSIPEIEAPHGDHKARSTKHEARKEEASAQKHEITKLASEGLQTTNYKLQTTSQRPSVDSVSSIIPPAFSKPKLMGPMEELSTMSLEDFRRLGNAADAVRKLNDKVELLAADSLLEKKKGLDAWKKSEVYKIYLIMGTESLEKKIGIAEVVVLRKNQNQPTLTVEEFSAVADLNRKISFSN